MFENYTSYAKGINGPMVDIRNIADTENLSASDFEIHAGNNNAPSN